MRDLGLDVAVDEIGNVVGTRAGTDPAAAPVMTGSHIDTVRTGGRYDGNLGVLAGLEVVETLERHGVRTRHPLAVAFFTNEEGARFQPDMLGSLVYVGGLALEDALDVAAIDGPDPRRRAAPASATPGRCRAPRRRRRTPSSSCTSSRARCWRRPAIGIGAVTGVQGISWQELTIDGQSNHAGTTPMAMRHDAAYVAAEIAAFVRRAGARSWAATRSARSGASSCSPTWSTWWPAGPR